jgi:hypothetical protein
MAHPNPPHPHPPRLTPVSTATAHTHEGPLTCSFCERTPLEVGHLWAGAHARVCNDCIQFMYDLIAAEKVQDEMLDATDDA